MISAKIDVKISPVTLRLSRLPRRNKIVTAAILNRQWKKSRTIMTRHLSKKLAITPQKRIRRRIILPKGAHAKPEKLVAQGLALFDHMPARWFAKGVRGRGNASKFTLPLPASTSVLLQPPAKGGPFKVRIKKYTAIMRRSASAKSRPARNSTKDKPRRTTLPIVEMFIDTSLPGRRAVDLALDRLADEFPIEYARLMSRELRRVFP